MVKSWEDRPLLEPNGIDPEVWADSFDD